MRTIKMVANHYYHIYNRGVDHAPIFFENENWGFFIRRLRKYSIAQYMDIVAYCLMPNHYHLLVRVNGDDIGRKVMQPFTVSYTKAINRSQRRVGHLFQGPYQVRLVENDVYLKWLTRYIHLNPVAAGLVNQPADWKFSSYRDYIGLRAGTLPACDFILKQFPSRVAYIEFVERAIRSETGLTKDILFDEER